MTTGTIYRQNLGEFVISDDKARIDRAAVHAYITESYWAPGVSFDAVSRSIDGSIPLGLYDGAERQIGFGRIITDGVRFAYLKDVYVLDEYQGRGLGNFLIGACLSHPRAKDVLKWMLATTPALHKLYGKYGFEPVDDPNRYMTATGGNVRRNCS